MPFVVLIFVILIALLVINNIRVVSQAHCMVIERLGQFHVVWKAGIHVKIPFIDTVVKKISLKEQVLDFPPQSVITKDNVSISIDSVVYASVYDAKRYTYGVEDPMSGLQNLTATTLRSVIGDMELDATLSSREQINQQMRETLDKATDNWGIKVSRVEIKTIKPPKDIEEVMTKQMKAERERRQTLLEAEAHRESVVAKAEGDKQAMILAAEAERDSQIALAEGKAKAVRMVYEAEAAGIASLAEIGMSADSILRLKSIEAMKDVADGQATKIFIPNDLSQSMATVGVYGDLLGTSQTLTGKPRSQVKKEQVMSGAKAQLKQDDCMRPGTTQATQMTSKTNAKMQHALKGMS